MHLVESSFKSSLEMLELAARHSAILLLTSVRICRSAYEVCNDVNKKMARLPQPSPAYCSLC